MKPFSYKQMVPLKRPNLPPELFNMKELPPGGEEEEEEDEQEDETENRYEMDEGCKDEEEEDTAASEVDTEPVQADEREHVEVSGAGKHAERKSPKGQWASKCNADLEKKKKLKSDSLHGSVSFIIEEMIRVFFKHILS